jgi:hypothetical protein
MIERLAAAADDQVLRILELDTPESEACFGVMR